MPDDTPRAPRRADAERNDRALLEAAREILAGDGAHASVAAIAERAGVGIGSLYRRYRTKEELFQRLAVLALDAHQRAADDGWADDDPWAGLVRYVTSAIASGRGSIGAIAGTIVVSAEMAEKSARADGTVRALVARAHRSGVLRADVTPVDVSLLIEQFARSPLLDQLRKQGRDGLVPAAREAHTRLVALALDGLRAPAAGPLPGDPPSPALLSARWEPA